MRSDFAQGANLSAAQWLGEGGRSAQGDTRLVPCASGGEWESSRKEHKGHREMKRINPHWQKSLIFHLIALVIATFVGIDIIYDKAFCVGLFALWLALISPWAYPIVGPYMVALFLAAHIEVLQLFFWPVVVLSYVAYLAFLLGAILENDKYVRVGCCIVLSAWFVLTLFGFSEWAMYWSM